MSLKLELNRAMDCRGRERQSYKPATLTMPMFIAIIIIIIIVIVIISITTLLN
jgi:hypothetical protein